MGWGQPFHPPIPADGGELTTLRDAAHYITERLDGWRGPPVMCAAKCLVAAAESGDPHHVVVARERVMRLLEAQRLSPVDRGSSTDQSGRR